MKSEPAARRSPRRAVSFFVQDLAAGGIRKADGNKGGNAFFLHRDAVELVGHLHGAAAVGDDQELRAAAQPVQIVREALDVRLVQSRLDLVQQTERGRLQVLDGKQQCDRGQRLFAAGNITFLVGSCLDIYKAILLYHFLFPPFNFLLSIFLLTKTFYIFLIFLAYDLNSLQAHYYIPMLRIVPGTQK